VPWSEGFGQVTGNAELMPGYKSVVGSMKSQHSSGSRLPRREVRLPLSPFLDRGDKALKQGADRFIRRKAGSRAVTFALLTIRDLSLWWLRFKR